MYSDAENSEYEQFEHDVERAYQRRSDHRKRRTGQKNRVRQSYADILDDVEDVETRAVMARTTYRPGLFEEGWLEESLKPFFLESLILDVLGRVKGGKEANVYRCEAHPATGLHLLAAKVFRPRMFRNLRNDAMYREGRELLAGTGEVVRQNEARVSRALSKKTRFGEEVAHVSWLMHEFRALQVLHAQGGRVPAPFRTGPNAIVMAFIGDESMAAPPLHAVNLDSDEAPELFDDVLGTVELMLSQRMVHGDLSAHNILYWERQVYLIDFPQVTVLDSNSQAQGILRRDLERVCEYFSKQGVTATARYVCDPDALMKQFRRVHFGKLNRSRRADSSRYWPEE
jgi:RIO kinase 1